MQIEFHGLPSPVAAQLRKRDAHGAPPERHVSDGDGYPCRHCLLETPRGSDYLILAHRPFDTVNPYAETGPIFLCAEECRPHVPTPQIPPILVSPEYLLRGYSADERIVYGSGQVVATGRIAARAAELLQDPRIAFVDVRSASNNCFQCRVRRAG